MKASTFPSIFKNYSFPLMLLLESFLLPSAEVIVDASIPKVTTTFCSLNLRKIKVIFGLKKILEVKKKL